MTELSEPDRRIIRLHLDWCRRRGQTAASLRHRGAVLRRLAPVLPGALLDATEQDLEDWQAGLQVSLSSIGTYTAHVRGFYSWCVEAGHLQLDSARRLPRPKLPPRRPRPIPEDEFAVALACAQEPLRTWLLLAGFMGLRAMEVAQIRREDVTEVAGRLLISGIGKGGKAFTLPVPAAVAPFLAAHLQQTKSGPLWRRRDGRPVTPDGVSRIANRFLDRIGLSHTLHSLRHRFCTALYGDTLDLALVQDVARHASPATTRLYVATGGDLAAAAMDKLATAGLSGGLR